MDTQTFKKNARYTPSEEGDKRLLKAAKDLLAAGFTLRSYGVKVPSLWTPDGKYLPNTTAETVHKMARIGQLLDLGEQDEQGMWHWKMPE